MNGMCSCFQRNSKALGMIATEEGKIAITAAQEIIQCCEQMQQQFKHLAERNVNGAKISVYPGH